MANVSDVLQDFELPDVDMPVGVAVLGGALLGAVGAFLFLTERGGQVRRDISAKLDHLLGGFDQVLTGWNDLQQRASGLRGFVDGQGTGRSSTREQPVA